MQLTKEKVVFGVAAALTVALCMRIHKPQVENVPAVPPEEAPHVPRVTVPIPPLHPEKPYPMNANRDPFVRTTDWAPSRPAILAPPPAPSVARALPGGTPSGKAPLIMVDQEPKKDDAEPDPEKKE